MPILNFTSVFPGEINVGPRLARLICNDSYATITEAGYLGTSLLEGNPLSPSDYIFASYGSSSSTHAILVPSISNGVVTLSALPGTPSSVTYAGNPVSGDVVKFNNTSGQIIDSGIPASSVSTFTGATVVGNFSKFNSISGQMIDSGIAANSASTFTGATVVGDVPKFNNTSGQFIDSGTALSALQLKANLVGQQFTWAGGDLSNTFSFAGVLTTSLVWEEVVSSANPTIVNSAKILSNGNVTISFTADPGALVINIFAFVAPQ